MTSAILDWVLGRKLANREAASEKLTVFSGLPAMGLDGLGSAAYGPEAALTILAVAGGAGVAAVAPITWIILTLLAILYFSYRQTIAAYPNNGGSYVVASDNLGRNAGLLAASALMIDYTLNVAVGISAGVGALTSALPSLQPYTLPLCLGILTALTLVNLRGTKESGIFLAVPTYLFIASLGLVLVLGLYQVLGGAGAARPVIAPPGVQEATGGLTLWLLLRAFASGCTAMTGVEAVSNGVGAFQEPRVPRAHGTLTAISVVLGLLLAGIAVLARAYGIGAMDQTKDGYQSVLSQLIGAIWGHGWLYDLTIASILAVLCLSANTSFVGFPRLCQQVARDGFLPAAFAVPGRRLVYSAGVLFLAGFSGALLAAFGGITDRLIPLFAVGAFLSFTLSQAGMAMHWRKQGGAPARLAINGIGALATGIALAIILVAKFVEGAWVTVIAIPIAVLLLRAVHRYYDRIDQQVRRGYGHRIHPRKHHSALAVVPIKQWDDLARKAVEFAMCVAPEVTALHVDALDGPDAEDQEQRLRNDWKRLVADPASAAGLKPPTLKLVGSEYRSVVAPLLREIEEELRAGPDRPILVVLPELVEQRWWASIMHVHRERKLREQLLHFGGKRVAVISVPWQVDRASPEQGIAEEEPAAPVAA